MKVPVGVSARHCHLSKDDLETLFGKGYELKHFKDLSQPGQYACEEKITVVSEAGREIAGVRILGPTRPQSQIEISRSDAIRGKFTAPVRSSGDLAKSGPCTIKGPKGEVKLSEGIIVADRHIHMHTTDGEKFGVKDREIVSVKIEGKKGGVMDNVLIRVHENFALDFHIDTDDACAFELSNGSEIEIIK